MFRYINVTAKGLILVLLPLIFSLGFAGFLAHELSQTADEFNELKTAQMTLYQLNQVCAKLMRSVTVAMNYRTMDPAIRRDAVLGAKAMFSKPGYIGDLKVDAPGGQYKELFEDAEVSRKMSLRVIAKAELDLKVGREKAFANKDRDEILLSMLTFRSLFDRIRASTSQLDKKEPAELDRLFGNVCVALSFGIAGSFILSFILAFMFTFDIVRRLEQISNNAYLLAAGKKLPPAQEGTDEIAELDKALHRTGEQLDAIRKKELVILNNAADILCSVDKQLRFLAIGEAAQRIWGYKTDDLLGRSLLTILTSDTMDGAREQLELAATSGEPANIDAVVKCKDGILKDSRWTVGWSHDAQEFVCVVHDITEIRNIERLKQAFFSMVSHDLRTPLASININLANMSSGVCGPLPERAEKLLENSVTSMARLTALVNDLLELEKLDSGKLNIELECISLRDVCEAGVEALESMAAGGAVDLAPPSGDAAVMADERRLLQAVTNLLSNAIKFSPPGSKIRTVIRRHDQLVEIAVIDQGPGVAKEDQLSLFDKYAQGPASSNVAVKGTGLGLAIVKSIVTAHGGTVGVDSQPGEGATFWIRLKEFVDPEEASDEI